MKKNLFIIGILMLSVLLVPFVVKAETSSIQQMHNNISKDGKLTISSIPIDHYKGSEYFEQCTSHGGDTNSCLNNIYQWLVESHLNQTITKIDGLDFWINDCDLEKNTCKIEVFDLNNISDEREYTISFSGKYNEDAYKKSTQLVKNLKSQNFLSDMSYINQMINYGDEQNAVENFIEEAYNSYKIFKIFPELKNELEKNPNYKFVPVGVIGGGTPVVYGGAATIVIYDNGVAVNIKDIGYNTIKTVYVPENEKNTEEDYIKTAENRIKEYINDSNYKISIEKDVDFVEEVFARIDNVDLSNFFNYIFDDEKTYIANLYKLTINDAEYLVGILPVSSKNIITQNIKSKNYKTNISMETSDSRVPLDTVINAEDVTEKYKKHEITKAFDISLYSDLKQNYISTIKTGVSVRIPISDNYDKETVVIYHIKDDGTKGDKYTGKVELIDGKKYALFTTNHFSVYAIDEVGEAVPNTSDNVISSICIGIISLIGLIAVTMYLKKINKLTN